MATNKRNYWKELSLKDRAQFYPYFIEQGIISPKDIADTFNSIYDTIYQQGPEISSQQDIYSQWDNYFDAVNKINREKNRVEGHPGLGTLVDYSPNISKPSQELPRDYFWRKEREALNDPNRYKLELYGNGGNIYDGESEDSQQIETRKPLFNRKKIADRVPGDGMSGGTRGIYDAVKKYLTAKDTYVTDRIRGYMDDFTKGKISAEELESILVHEDGKRIYLGLPQLYNTFEPSADRPTIGKSEEPYQLNNLLSDSSFDNLIFPLWGSWKTNTDWPVYDTGSRVKNLGKTAQVTDIPFLQAAGISEGFDNKGQYISLYDVWDYNSRIKNKSGDNVGKWVGGKPFEVYQRYYLDDWLDIPEDSRGNPYIAPAYIEAEYTGNQNAKGGNLYGLGSWINKGIGKLRQLIGWKKPIENNSTSGYEWSDDQITDIAKAFETYQNKAYIGVKGDVLGGYGHKMTKDEIGKYWNSEKQEAKEIIPDRIIQGWLKSDMDTAFKSVDTYYGKDIPSNIRAALAALSFQGGDKLIRGKRDDAGNIVDSWGGSPNFERAVKAYIKDNSQDNLNAIFNQMQYKDDNKSNMRGLSSRYGLYRAIVENIADPKKVQEYKDSATFNLYRSNKTK